MDPVSTIVASLCAPSDPFAGCEEANNKCPQCSHSPFNDSTITASNNTRRTVKSWLKEQKAKADKPAAPAAIEPSVEKTPQPMADTSQGSNNIGDDTTEAPEKIDGTAPVPLAAEEQPMPSIEVCRPRFLTRIPLT